MCHLGIHKNLHTIRRRGWCCDPVAKVRSHIGPDQTISLHPDRADTLVHPHTWIKRMFSQKYFLASVSLGLCSKTLDIASIRIQGQWKNIVLYIFSLIAPHQPVVMSKVQAGRESEARRWAWYGKGTVSWIGPLMSISFSSDSSWVLSTATGLNFTLLYPETSGRCSVIYECKGRVARRNQREGGNLFHSQHCWTEVQHGTRAMRNVDVNVNV